MANIFHIDRPTNTITLGTAATIINPLGTFYKNSTLAAGLNVLRVTGLQTDATALTGTLRGAYIDVSNGSTAATGTIRAMELKARTEAPGDTGNDVAVLEGLSISADSKAHNVGTMRAAEFILDGKTAGTIDEAVGLRIANNLQVDKATISYGLQIYRDSFDYTADIQLSNGGTIGGSSGVMTIDSAGNTAVGSLTTTRNATVGNILVVGATPAGAPGSHIQMSDYAGTMRSIINYGIDVNNHLIIQTGTTSGARAIIFKTESVEQLRILANNTITLGTGTSIASVFPIDTGATPSKSQFSITANALGKLALFTYAADNSGIFFDAYYNSGWKSADAGSNFGIYKFDNVLKLVYDSGVAVNGTVTWNDGLIMDIAGNVGIGTATPTAAFQMGDDKLIAVDVNAGITASVTQTQGNGTLTAQVNEISIVANKDDNVTLPSAVTGIVIEIINNGANTLWIFPASGDDLGLGVNLPEELEANERVVFVAYDTTNWAKESSTEIIHAEIHDEDNTDAFVINVKTDFHSYHTNGLVAGDLADWTFDAGGAGTSHVIDSIADGADSGVDIAVTTADNHLLADGDIVSQTNLTSAVYTGIFVVKDIISPTIYEVAAVYTATDTGTMDQAATLEANAVAAGVYDFAYYISGTLVGNNETFDFQLYKGATAVTGSKIRRKFGAANDFGSMSGGGVVSVASGDKISFSLSNEDTAANIILRNLTIVLVRL